MVNVAIRRRSGRLQVVVSRYTGLVWGVTELAPEQPSLLIGSEAIVAFDWPSD